MEVLREHYMYFFYSFDISYCTLPLSPQSLLRRAAAEPGTVEVQRCAGAGVSSNEKASQYIRLA